ncbi:putative RNA-binding protein [Exophiala dermatitidis]
MGEKKRKGSSGATDLPPKKTKKSKSADVVADKPAASAPKDEPVPADNASAVASKKSRKRAADFMNEEESTKAVAPTTASTAVEEPAVKKSKKSKKNKKGKEDQILTADGVNGVVEHPGDEDLETATAQKPADISMQAEAERTLDQELENDFRAVASEDEAGYVDEVEVEDNAAALLKGFDSDTEDKQEDTGLDLSTTPALPKSKKVQKKLDKIKAEGKDDGPGAVYVGRIPHGFYEKQMREYFSQFGDITRLRLSRNKRTGASKHFAFIEFASNEVAKIVAETMDNYLLFGHILKCKYAPPDSLHPDVWKGANKKFRKIPHEKLEREKLAAPKTADKWQKKVEKEQRKREEKAKKLKAIGVDMPASTLANPSDVVKDKLITAEEPNKAIEASKPDTAEKEAQESKKEKTDKKKDKKNKDKKAENAKEEKAAAVSVEPEAAKDVESASAEKEAEPEASAETKADKSAPGVPLSKKERKALNKAETTPESEMTKEERKALRNARSKLAQAQAQAKTPKAGLDAKSPAKPTQAAEQPSVEEEKVADAPVDKKNDTAPEPVASKDDSKKAKKSKKEKKEKMEKKKAKGSKDETVARGEEEQPVKADTSADASKPTETEEQSAFATDADFVSFGDINDEKAEDESESDADAPDGKSTRATLSNASRGPTVPKGKAALKAYKKEMKEKKALKKKERKNLVKARGPKSGLVATNPKPAPLTVPGKIPGVPLLGKGKYDKAKRQAYKELKKNVLKRNILRKSKAGQPATDA